MKIELILVSPYDKNTTQLRLFEPSTSPNKMGDNHAYHIGIHTAISLRDQLNDIIQRSSCP